ncbi:MAG: sugar nucleotide-binding protein [Bryobacterales bacterium]|nr:sugar nucleotide-binding protein [Bryobacterales bacterium]
MTGRYLTDVYRPEELYLTDIETMKPNIHHLDIRDKNQVMDVIGTVKPKLVIHLAAETNVDLCEQRPDHAYKSNFVGSMNLALACAKHNVDLAYVSTAGVFGGDQEEPYTEFDDPRPINVYAKSKLEGEKIIRSLMPNCYVARAGWMFGGSRQDKKFVGKIAQQCLDQAPRPHLKAVSDKKGSPTFARDFLAQLRVLTESGNYGLYHLVNGGESTRHGVAVEVARILQVDAHVEAVGSDVFPLPATRPNSESARNYKLELLGLNRMRSWQEALQEYLQGWQAEKA